MPPSPPRPRTSISSSFDPANPARGRSYGLVTCGLDTVRWLRRAAPATLYPKPVRPRTPLPISLPPHSSPAGPDAATPPVLSVPAWQGRADTDRSSRPDGNMATAMRPARLGRAFVRAGVWARRWSRNLGQGSLPSGRLTIRGFMLLDWTGREIRENKCGAIPDNLAPILDRLGLDRSNWVKTVRECGRMFNSSKQPVARVRSRGPRRVARDVGFRERRPLKRLWCKCLSKRNDAARRPI